MTSPPKEESHYESQYKSIAAQNSGAWHSLLCQLEANSEHMEEGKNKIAAPSANMVARVLAPIDEGPMPSGGAMPKTVLACTKEEGLIPTSEAPITEASTTEEEPMPDTNPIAAGRDTPIGCSICAGNYCAG